MQPTPMQWNTRPSLLGAPDIEAIHAASLGILEHTGIVMPLADSRFQVLEAYGARVDRTNNRVRLSPEMVHKALQQAPATYTLCARDPRWDLSLEGAGGYLSLDGTGLKLIDIHSGQRRASTYQDLCDAAWVADALPQIAFLWPCLSARDRPAATQPLHELLALLIHSGKHVQAMTAVDPVNAQGTVAMAATVAGGREQLRQRPIVSNFQCSVSPLCYDGEGLEAALVFAAAGIPTGFLNMPIGCSTAPASLAGNLALGNAEILAGITFLQTFFPGSPTFYGSCATVMELRRGGVTCGGPEDFLLQAASVQMANHYRLPSNVGTFATGAKQSNWQAGVENALSGMVSLFCGADMMCGAGLINGATTFAFEQLLMDCEIYDLLHAMTAGITVNADTLAAAEIDAIGPNNHFMLSDHTLQHMGGIWQPTIMERGDHDDWVGRGSPPPAATAREKALKILRDHEPMVLECKGELEEIVAEYECRAAEKEEGK